MIFYFSGTGNSYQAALAVCAEGETPLPDYIKRKPTEEDAERYQTLFAKNEGAVVANPISDNIALTDKYVEDASFLRLSSLTIGYSLPDRWLKKAYIKTARIFFTGSNLFCVTPYSGADPEVDTRTKINPLATGVDFSAFPKSRAFNFGVNLSF